MAIRNLVTVFCLRDLAQFRLQVESLRYLTEPVTHWVIINEPQDQYHHCCDLVQPLYLFSPHQLRLVPRPLTLSSCDWDNQQYYKLWIYQLIQQDYLILDCKNFFIRSCSLADWQGVIGSGSYDHYLKEGNTFSATLRYYCSLFGLPVESEQFSCQTPFLAESRVMDHLDLEQFAESVGLVSPCEFLYYGLTYRSLGGGLKKPQHLHRTIWPDETLDLLRPEFHNPYLVFAFHRRWLLSDTVNLTRAQQALLEWGFRSQLTV